MSGSEGRVTGADLEREAALAQASAAPLSPAGGEALAMLVRRGFQPSLAELDLPFDPAEVDVGGLLEALDRYALRLLLRGAIARGDGFAPEETSRFLTPEVAAEGAAQLAALGVAARLPDGRYRLARPAASFGGTLEWYVAHALQRRLRVDAVAGVKLHAPGLGGDLDVAAAAEGKLIAIELKSSPPKHLKEPELDAFVARLRALRPDVAVFAMDTALRLGDRVIPMLEAAATRAGGAPAVRRVERELWSLSPHVYVVNARPSLVSNIARAVAEGLRAIAPPPL
ncbi:MAG TPA: hypothetical protein VFF45_00830 [Bacilli bacterium]|nr:hypothetical protein [Bacilli bacterium]